MTSSVYGGTEKNKSKMHQKGNSVRTTGNNRAAKDDLVVLKPKQAFLGLGGIDQNSQITLNPVQSQKVLPPPNNQSLISKNTL